MNQELETLRKSAAQSPRGASVLDGGDPFGVSSPWFANWSDEFREGLLEIFFEPVA
jgi:hypothetical protein